MKNKNDSINIFFKEQLVCVEKECEGKCSFPYHFENKPNKAFFYKKPYPKEKYKNFMQKKLKNKLLNQNYNFMALNGMDEKTSQLVQLIKFFSKFEEEFFIEFADIDFERHVKQAYSIIETNKMKIKTSYLNQYALDHTHLPDLVKIFNNFNILNHISVIFESYI